MPKSALFMGKMGPPKTITVQRTQPNMYRLQGFTRDKVTNAIVAGVTVEIYESNASDASVPSIEGVIEDEPHGKLRDVVISDANGRWYSDVTSTEASGLRFKAVAYKAGAPNVSGSSVPTLEGTPI